MCPRLTIAPKGSLCGLFRLTSKMSGNLGIGDSLIKALNPFQLVFMHIKKKNNDNFNFIKYSNLYLLKFLLLLINFKIDEYIKSRSI